MNVTIYSQLTSCQLCFIHIRKFPRTFEQNMHFCIFFSLKVTYKLRISVKEATGRKKKNYEPATLGSAALSNRTKCMFWPFNGLLLFFSLYSASSAANLGRGCLPAGRGWSTKGRKEISILMRFPTDRPTSYSNQPNSNGFLMVTSFELVHGRKKLNRYTFLKILTFYWFLWMASQSYTEAQNCYRMWKKLKFNQCSM